MSTDTQIFGPPVVEAVDVHHHYGEGAQRADVLFDINMQVREGELVIVTGPSGSGKTTLLTILGTMRRPSEGKLRLLYENAPLAFLCERAGGAASDGKQRILDIVPSKLHERTPLYLGSKGDVEEATRRLH